MIWSLMANYYDVHSASEYRELGRWMGCLQGQEPCEHVYSFIYNGMDDYVSKYGFSAYDPSIFTVTLVRLAEDE